MARVTDRLLVQRCDDLIVVMDDSTGAEVTFDIEAVPRVLAALLYLAGDAPLPAPRAPLPDLPGVETIPVDDRL